MKLVLLPGLDGTGNLFKPLIDALPADTETVVISYPTNEQLGYEELIEYVLPRLPEETFILVGESFSGPIANAIVQKIPERIKTVIFVATFLNNPRVYTSAISGFISIYLKLGIQIPDFIFKALLSGPSTNKYLKELFSKSLKQVSPDVIAFRLREISRLHPPLKNNSTSAIYIQATDDKLVPAKSAGIFENVYPQIQIIKVPGSHLILQTRPGTCAEIIKHEM